MMNCGTVISCVYFITRNMHKIYVFLQNAIKNKTENFHPHTTCPNPATLKLQMYYNALVKTNKKIIINTKKY